MDDTLTKFLCIYKDDDNEWYRLGSGETQNLFDALLSRAEAAEVDALHLGERLNEWIDRAHNSETEVKVQREAHIHYRDKWFTAQAEVERMRTQVAQLTRLWQNAIDADLADDPHELEAAIVKAAMLLDPQTGS